MFADSWLHKYLSISANNVIFLFSSSSSFVIRNFVYCIRSYFKCLKNIYIKPCKCYFFLSEDVWRQMYCNCYCNRDYLQCNRNRLHCGLFRLDAIHIIHSLFHLNTIACFWKKVKLTTPCTGTIRISEKLCFTSKNLIDIVYFHYLCNILLAKICICSNMCLTWCTFLANFLLFMLYNI